MGPTDLTSQTLPRLPLSSFEHYMLADDRRDYAMTCHIRYWFAGRFDRAVLEEALKVALRRHPLMQATVAGPVAWGRQKDLRWVPVTETPEVRLPFISWKDEGEPIEAPPGGMRSDLTKEIGLRLWLRESERETMMLWQFHHSVCDGAGFFAFTEDWLAAYGQLVGAGSSALRAVDERLLAQRDDLGLTRRDLWRRVGKDVQRTLKFFKVVPSPLLPPRVPGIGRTGAPDLQAVVRTLIAEDDVARLARHAKRAGATMNDIMMRELFVALDDWNRQQDPVGGRRWIRIAMPTDLRLPGEEQMSAANVVSMVFLDRKGAEIDNPRALLAGLARETRFLKEQRMGITLVRVMRVLGHMWGALTLFMRLPLCSSTAVLTNLGRPFMRSPLAKADGRIGVGEVTLTGLETLPPLRKRTRVAFSINSYGGPMRVTMRYDTTIYSPLDARDIIGLYALRLRRAAMAEDLATTSAPITVPAPVPT